MKLTVTLPTHSYDLTIETGALDKIGTWVRSLWQPQRVAIITDETVNKLYGAAVEKELQAAGFETSLIAVAAGEQSKSLETAQLLYDFLAEQQLTRSDGLIALGGGVVGDLAGFVASTYMRGIHFLQVPTTLLAQVDSSIGGKTAVNTKKAKNLVGTFAQPDGVLIDPNTLKTLEPRRVREGIAEIVKSAAIADVELWHRLSSLENEQDLVVHAEEIITACCKIKRDVVEEDELDLGLRLILNFGHTIGHALENTAGYGVITHGEGVSLGMIQITQVAEQRGLSPLGTTQELVTMLEKFHLPITTDRWPEERLYQAITHDKKTRGGQIKIIVLEKIGQAKIVSLPTEEIRAFLNREGGI
ncbi:3-dehydroquinate synthase [Enterococcus faecalis]|uniref:3-dehydroquinate synthase n=1 Tax=Enterococcus faecalis TaxID=1351 RepID=UPI00032DC714|nr:3-dehydroquinate synthase [Enterococcus faecalis]EGO7919738.1 3-dehydroquinate synthase [Enterococcus faecalis]EGO7922103.1 3-dehydroquinate synthase [Enterococcus faecalis]EHK9492511.1 3-dehydroquinate synthase [Enterococcus faecalis]EHK9495155.1 3-dehydroquinate synthase [Enterococcus faecalis]EKG8980334.1 3-dehydroquinate synthase [Enterococcus faecalis]